MSILEKTARDVHELISGEIPHKYPEGQKWWQLINSDAFKRLGDALRPDLKSTSKDTVKTANALGLSANQNFKRIMSDLQDIHASEDDHSRRLILGDSILLLQQQNAEIHTLLREQQC